MTSTTFNKQLNSLKKLILLFLIFNIYSCSEVTHIKLGKENAINELKGALNGGSQHNVVDYKELLIKNEKTAIQIAEPILFEIYGESHIKDQKPYEVNLIDNYWVINGTLRIGMLGGTFVIIIDARNSKVLKISHYK
ncbi:YbbC/YhhH family protein [Flavobacterium sp. DG2-3]|uniref:YbbC/YhhH family protein n=1 Tax=Flavobacterium sp. DG2-3 TaxID=3068317 RepID=UPI00273D522B|nr:YbbC/YhhH family protein [Flavobacterium sp. DG2-3]MDP5201470.1 YbbC/YhhH family protein [Flavobacterium sp. DG2-3]